MIAASGAACLAYGIAIEPNLFRLRRVRVPVLPPGHRPIRILHLTDLHLLPTQSRKIAWVRGLAELKPDFIVNTGDNVASADALPGLRHAFEPLRGIPGVFVFGSNDFDLPGPVRPLRYFRTRPVRAPRHTLPNKDLARLLESLGWVDAQEQRTVFHLDGTTVEVRGCGDAHAGLDHYARVAGPVAGDADLLVGVTHAPYRRLLDQMTADGVGLILAGHTHGGQVCLPGGHALTTNCDLPTSQAKGLSRHRYNGRMAYLHVSAGLGTSPYAPYRFCCPPEATLLTLTPPER